jgi:two-component system response regulator FixJ
MTKSAGFVHVIDDDDAVRESFALLLESDGFQTRSFASGRDFLAALVKENLAETAFGCVLSDIRMPDLSGLELLAELKKLDVKLPIVLITAYADVALAVQAMKMGAADFIEKPCDEEELISSVRNALADFRDVNAQEAEKQAYLKRLESLSERENDVLAGLLEGKLNKTIAYDLGVSVRTVETHRAAIMSKTNARSLSELVRLSLLAGWK